MKHLQFPQHKDKEREYIVHSTDGEFTLLVNSPIVSITSAPPGHHFVDIKTGENIGKELVIRKQLCDGLKILDEPIILESEYDIVAD